MTVAATLDRPPRLFAVPREHLGRARVWRAALSAEDEAAADRCIHIASALRKRLAKGSLPRPEALQEAARAWRDDVPPFGRLKLEIESANRRLVIRDLRMGAVRHAQRGWVNAEDALAIFIVGFRLVRWEFEFTQEVVAAVSLHALGRRFGRGLDNSDAAIRRDLVALASAATDPRMDITGQFHVRVADGAWVGRMSQIDADTLILSARTFLADWQLAGSRELR